MLLLCVVICTCCANSTTCTQLALTSAATFLLLCGYLGNSTPVAITLLTIAVGIGGLIYGGHCVNHLDIGASHAGVLMGLTNMFGTIPGFVGPQVAKLIAATVCQDYVYWISLWAPPTHVGAWSMVVLPFEYYYCASLLPFVPVH